MIVVLGYIGIIPIFWKYQFYSLESLQCFVFSALQVTGMALWFASPEIRRCKDFVISAVRRTGALQEVYHCCSILFYVIPYHTVQYFIVPWDCPTCSLCLSGLTLPTPNMIGNSSSVLSPAPRNSSALNFVPEELRCDREATSHSLYMR